MKTFNKKVSLIALSIMLMAPAAPAVSSVTPNITVNARSRALSYYRAKRDVRKAYNGKDREDDYFRLHNDGRSGRNTYLKASFGAEAVIYFRVHRSGRYVHIHVTIRTNTGYAHHWYYRTYGIRRNKTVRA